MTRADPVDVDVVRRSRVTTDPLDVAAARADVGDPRSRGAEPLDRFVTTQTAQVERERDVPTR